MERRQSGMMTVTNTDIAVESKKSSAQQIQRMTRTSTGVAGTPGDRNNRQFLSPDLKGSRSLQATSGHEMMGTIGLNPSNSGYESRRQMVGNSMTSGTKTGSAMVGDPENSYKKITFDEQVIKDNWTAYMTKRANLLSLDRDPTNPGHAIQAMSSDGVTGRGMIMGDKGYVDPNQ